MNVEFVFFCEAKSRKMQDRRKPVCTWQRQTPQRHLAADGSRQELGRLGPVP